MAGKKESGLGSGLASLFGDDVYSVLNEIQNNAASGGEVSDKVVQLKVDEIKANPYQPRTVFDEDKLNELAQSIKENGVFTPILVRKTDVGYELIAGERRLKASKMAGLEKIPAIIVKFDDQQMMEVSLLENIQRENLNVIEEARAYQQLIEKFGYTQEQLAEKVGKSRTHITNTMRLLKLPDSVIKMIEDGKITMGHAKPLVSLDSEEQIETIANKAAKEGLSVRQVEYLATDLRKPSAHVEVNPTVDQATLAVQKNLQQKLQTKVKIAKHAINISYSDTEDLNRILELIGYYEDED